MLNRITLLLLAVVLGSTSACDNSDDTNPAASGDGIIAGAVSIDSPANLVGGKLPVNAFVTIPVRFQNTTGVVIQGATNGLRVYSPNGAQWSATSADTTGQLGRVYFDLVNQVTVHSGDGSGADTVGYGGAAMTMDGMPLGFNGQVFNITIGPINSSHTGRSVCIDSCWYRPIGTWKWSSSSANTIRPPWSGPYCWQIGS